MKVLHMIPSLENGGAERMLNELVLNNETSVENTICCIFNRQGWYEENIIENGVEIIKFDWSVTSFLPNIFKMIKLFKSHDIIQCWLYYSMLIGTIIGILTKKKIIWNVRQSAIEKKFLNKKNFYLIRFLKYFSIYPDLIISCSDRTLTKHKSLGYVSKKMFLIPNSTSYKLNLSENEIIDKEIKNEIYLCVGRQNKIKNHENLIIAFTEFTKKNKNAELWIVGYENNKNDNEKIKYINKTKEVSKYYKQAKFLVSSSYSEGFPNVIIESMAHGTPVIATDAGDSYRIIEGNGIKINGYDSKSILEALEKSADIKKREYIKLSKNSIHEVQEKYTIDKVSLEYYKAYKLVMKS